MHSAALGRIRGSSSRRVHASASSSLSMYVMAVCWRPLSCHSLSTLPRQLAHLALRHRWLHCCRLQSHYRYCYCSQRKDLRSSWACSCERCSILLDGVSKMAFPGCNANAAYSCSSSCSEIRCLSFRLAIALAALPLAVLVLLEVAKHLEMMKGLHLGRCRAVLHRRSHVQV